MSNPLQQHFMIPTEKYNDILKSIRISDFRVLELGVGTGTLTKMILDHNPRNILGYELDFSLPSVKGICEVYCDYTKEKFDFLDDSWALISNPAYDTYDFIIEHILPRVRVCVLMVPPRLVKTLEDLGFTQAMEMDGTYFNPPSSKGTHLIMVRQ